MAVTPIDVSLSDGSSVVFDSVQLTSNQVIHPSVIGDLLIDPTAVDRHARALALVRADAAARECDMDLPLLTLENGVEALTKFIAFVSVTPDGPRCLIESQEAKEVSGRTSTILVSFQGLQESTARFRFEQKQELLDYALQALPPALAVSAFYVFGSFLLSLARERLRD